MLPKRRFWSEPRFLISPKKKKVKIEVNKIMNPSDFEERKITTKYHTNLCEREDRK